MVSSSPTTNGPSNTDEWIDVQSKSFSSAFFFPLSVDCVECFRDFGINHYVSLSPFIFVVDSVFDWPYAEENNRLVTEYKAKVQRSEQEIVTLQANVSCGLDLVEWTRVVSLGACCPGFWRQKQKAWACHGNQCLIALQVARLESQVTRYKSAAESAEKNEEELKVEKRKLLREVSWFRLPRLRPCAYCVDRIHSCDFFSKRV